MFDPPKVRKVKILKLLWGFFRRQFAYFCLFWHLNRPRPAAQWVRPNFFGPEGGQTIPPHHSIAKYLKNLKLMSRTGTFILGHCVNRNFLGRLDLFLLLEDRHSTSEQNQGTVPWSEQIEQISEDLRAIARFFVNFIH